MLDALRSDLRFALRALRKSPGFSLVAVATLGLGIGGTTAIFSVVDHVLLRPLAYREAGRLYAVHEVVPRFAHIAPMVPVNAMHFGEWRRSARAFDAMALISGNSMSLTGAGEPEQVPIGRVTPVLFRMLGVQAAIGRTFLDEEDRAGRDDVVVLDYALWTRRFGGDPRTVGKTIILDGRPFRVVGVLPADFRFPKLSQLYAMTVAEQRPLAWKPFAVKPSELAPLGDFNYACIVSLRPGAALAEGVGQLDAVLAAMLKAAPEPVEVRAALVPLRDQMTGRSRTGLQLLLAAVGVVLLIGCVNIANLLLARATARRRELAIRVAVGAGRRRLMQQVLVESLVLALSGGVLGIAIAYAAVHLVVAAAPVDLPRLDEIRVDGRVLAFTIGLSLVSGLAFGLLPAWRFSRTDPKDAMQAGARGAVGSVRGGRLRTALVATEVASCALCLGVGGLLLHSYVRLLSVDAGFAPAQTVTVDLDLPAVRYPEIAQRTTFVRRLLDRVAALPGVTSAGTSNKLPLAGEGNNNLVAPEGSARPLMERPLADIRFVSRDYFKTMGIPLVAGRLFDEADADNPVALLSGLAAEKLWPGQDPLGRRVQVGADDSPPVTIVGVIGDVRGVALGKAPMMTVYRPYWQASRSAVSLAVRVAGDPGTIGAALRGAIHDLDPQLPVPAPRTMLEVVSTSVAQQRFQVVLVLVFGAVAALLASLGIYGVISYAVSQRTAELGVRTALGATPLAILALVVGQGLRPVAAGLVAGLAAAVAAGRVVSSLLYGVSPLDGLSLVAVVATVGAVSLVATLLPARRAMRVDPVAALRQD